MIFIADEGVDRQIVERIRQDGHQVVYVAEMSPGIVDDLVLRQSRDTASILITPDKDFGELVFRQGQASAGILLIRLSGLSPAQKALTVSAAIREHGNELPGGFAVLGPGNIRIRRTLPL